MNREDYLANVSRLLARLVHEVKVKNAAGLFDINKVAEDFYIPILSRLFACPDLKNQNKIRANFPAVDLGCKSARISIQITSDPSSNKVAKTLELFRKHNLQDEFDEVYILVITEKQNSYTSNKLMNLIAQLPVEFVSGKHIIDYRDLVAKLNDQETEVIGEINYILEQEFAKQDSEIQFREELDNFIAVAQSKIEFEKNSKKYIPSIFIETSSVKEQVRYFANPLFFYRKINELVSEIDLTRLSMLLKMAQQEPIEQGPQLPLVSDNVKTLAELRDALVCQGDALRVLRTKIAPMSMDRGDAKRFEPIREAGTFSRIWRVPIESSAYGIKRLIDDTLEAIELTQAKVLLITGMAGQGKTNFVCDLVENQFRKFRIPSVFIPARELNGYSGQNRIFDFIVNNRYAPDVRNLHELLKLFNAVAAEYGKPFIIAIDGINEVANHASFATELNAFLDAVAQYDFIKALITCRSEFFDQRFASMLEQPFSNAVFRVENLRARMTERHKDRLIDSYFNHFHICLRLGQEASEFLRNDLLLLRIFCEIEEGSPERFVATIYKGEVFEKFLYLKIKEFQDHLRRHVVPTLNKIAARMLKDANFSSLSTEGFDDAETAVIERLISEDIVLRSELAEPTLASAGLQNISFTYDELRDFMIAHYLVTDLAQNNLTEVESVFAQLEQMQIREGVFRYTYILSRKYLKAKLIDLCEQQEDFSMQYVNNIDLIPPDLQTDSDRKRVESILESSENIFEVCAIAVFLYHRRNLTDVLNINLLVSHISSLSDDECRLFLRTIFSDGYDNRSEGWSRKLSQVVLNFISHAKTTFPENCPPLLTFMLQICGFADWEYRETIFNRFASLLEGRDVAEQLNRLQVSKSDVICNSTKEIWNIGA